MLLNTSSLGQAVHLPPLLRRRRQQQQKHLFIQQAKSLPVMSFQTEDSTDAAASIAKLCKLHHSRTHHHYDDVMTKIYIVIYIMYIHIYASSYVYVAVANNHRREDWSMSMAGNIPTYEEISLAHNTGLSCSKCVTQSYTCRTVR